MKIAINCWVLRNKQLDGMGYFTVNTIARLIRIHPDVHFQILCDKNFTENYFDFKNVSKHYIFPPYRHPLLYIFYMEIVVAFFLKKHKPDVFVSADGFLSLLSGTKQLSIIYDINFEHFPKDLKLKNRLYFRFFFNRFARKARRIATISEYSKTDIIKFYKISPNKIDNVSCGINSNFSILPNEKILEIRRQVSNNKPYFFFVGSMHPRKNIRRLLKAFTLFKQKTFSDYKLLIAGHILWSKDEIEKEYNCNPVKDDIFFTGRVNDQELANLLGAAYALSFVPIFEGFGLPIVEAMQSAVPVICSSVTSMPEVAGEAAILVDPYNIEDICDAMVNVYENKDDLRNKLIEKGLKQKQLFTWDRTAKLLWNSIIKVTELP
ncbi:MAG: glycosyltransferase family 1 protein [Ginsengibacter sp.]